MLGTIEVSDLDKMIADTEESLRMLHEARIRLKIGRTGKVFSTRLKSVAISGKRILETASHIRGLVRMQGWIHGTTRKGR